MVDREVVRRRLQRLDEYLGFLARLGEYSRDELLSEPERYGAAERFLQLAIEALCDMGNHVVADEGLGSVEAYGDIPRLLAKAGILDGTQSEQWVRMIGFRNILVHEYLEIDREVVYQVLQERVGDLSDLRQVFARYLCPEEG